MSHIDDRESSAAFQGVFTARSPVELRAAAREFVSTLDSKQTVSVDASAHARQARATRVGQSKLRSSRLRKPPPEEN